MMAARPEYSPLSAHPGTSAPGPYAVRHLPGGHQDGGAIHEEAVDRVQHVLPEGIGKSQKSGIVMLLISVYWNFK